VLISGRSTLKNIIVRLGYEQLDRNIDYHQERF